ncbi:MAG TPA: amidohydrolase family protein [Bryobacteraceae bacterium]|nr:amidohydrolase family protein [Bryobacteraceae bacterium]
MKKLLSIAVLGACGAGAETIAITNARIVPISAPTIERATIVITDGRIAAMGARAAIPAGARRIDGTGLSVYPGWIDGWTTLGMAEIESVAGTMDTKEIGPFNPAAHAWIAVNPHSEMLKTARVNGVTTALVAPAGGIISGTASALNLFGMYPKDMLVLGDAGVMITLPSLYQAQRRERGETGPPPTLENRRRQVARDMERLKQYLREAKAYAEMRARGGPDAARDTSLEAMAPVMRGERPAIITANHFRDIRTAVDLAQEFGLKLIIAGGADAWKVADLLKEKNAGVLYAAVHALPRSQEDPYDVGFTTPEALRRAGVRFAIVTGSDWNVRNLPYQAAMAAAYGLEREDALKAITLWPAELLGISDKVGSLEVGKLANVLVSRGDPLDVRSEVRYVFIEGRQVPFESRNKELYEEFRQLSSPARATESR